MKCPPARQAKNVASGKLQQLCMNVDSDSDDISVNGTSLMEVACPDANAVSVATPNERNLHNFVMGGTEMDEVSFLHSVEDSARSNLKCSTNVKDILELVLSTLGCNKAKYAPMLTKFKTSGYRFDELSSSDS